MKEGTEYTTNIEKLSKKKVTKNPLKAISLNRLVAKMNREVREKVAELDEYDYILTLLRTIVVEGKALDKETKHLVKLHKFGNIGEWDSDSGEIYFGALVEFETGNICSIYLDYEGTLKKIKR